MCHSCKNNKERNRLYNTCLRMIYKCKYLRKESSASVRQRSPETLTNEFIKLAIIYHRQLRKTYLSQTTCMALYLKLSKKAIHK